MIFVTRRRLTCFVRPAHYSATARTSPHIPYFYVVGVAMSKLSLQVAAAVLTAAFSQLALAQMSPAQRFEHAPDDQPLRGVSLETQPVTVFLKMAGDPVAVVRSRAPGKQISEQIGRASCRERV